MHRNLIATMTNQKLMPFLISIRSVVCFAGLLMVLSGCATCERDEAPTVRHFNFETDSFAYANELVWDYQFDEQGKWTSHQHYPKPDYSHHCFVVVRSARQFFEHARFDPTLPVADAKAYRQLIDKVVSMSPHRLTPDSKKIVIPGYANLHDFSLAQPALLKQECGGAWQSYLQHGHWRMIMPFSRHQQETMADLFLEDLKAGHPPVVHLVRFPQLKINHAVLLFNATQTDKELRFDAYDPNNPEAPAILTFDRATRTFSLPTNKYFYGGRVDVYEVYRDWRY
jgi:hypothetical protein